MTPDTTDWKARAEVVEKENERLRDKIMVLEDALGLTREFPPLMPVRLTASEGRMLAMLLKRGFVATSAFMAALYDARPDADAPDDKIIDVFICKLRAKIKTFSDAKIETKWGEGYFIPAADKADLRKAFGEQAA